MGEAMLKEICPGVFIRDFRTGWYAVPQLNYSYIPGSGRSLMVDAGMPEEVSPDGLSLMSRDLEELGIRWQDLDCIITHAHRDHVGLAHILNEKGARVFVNPVDMQTREIMEFDFMDQERREAFYRRLGLKMSAPEVYEEFWKAGDFFVRGFEHCWEFSWEPMSPGERVSYGDYTFELVPLPGHTRGQMGLLDREKKLIFSGDQLLNGVASIVRDSGSYPDALEDYFTSMRAVKHDYADCLFIPGHGVPFRDPGADIDKVVGNYTEKLRIIQDCLKKSEKPLCVWGVSRRAYGQFGKEISPAMRQQFILIWMKTYACLAFLERRGLVVSKENEDGVPLWSPAV